MEHTAPSVMAGARAGAVVLVGVVVLNASNYLFHVVSARFLGPARYGDLATLLAISGLIALPLGGVQIWIARQVAEYEAVGDRDGARWFVRRTMGYAVVGGLVTTVGGIAASWWLQAALGIASIAAVGLTALTIFPSVTAPVVFGLAQGLQRFVLISGMYVVSALTRLALMAVAFGVGLRVGGAMIATLASLLVALAFAVWMMRDWFAPAPAAWRRVTRGEAITSLLPVVVGLLAITSLTTVDIVVAKKAFDDDLAGIYGSASLLGRAILYVTAAVVTVLLPRVAARAAGKRATSDLLRKSIVVTVAFCSAATVLYAIAGGPIVRTAFGSEFEEAAGLLWLFGIAMTGYAVLNIVLIYDLGRGGVRIAWLLAIGAVGQIGAFLILHDTPRQLLAVDIAAAGGLLVAEAIVTRGMLLGALLSRPGRADRPQ